MRVTRIKNLDPFYVIKWRLTDKCNYDCRYCIRKAFKHREAEFDPFDTARMVCHIARELPQDKPVKIDLIGGEVTILPYFIDLVQGLDVARVNITSNFSKPVEWWAELAERATAEITATFSYHPSQTKETAEQFAARAKEVSRYLTYVKVETVRGDHVVDLVKACQSYGVDYMVEGNLLNWTNEELKDISKPNKPRYEVTFEDGSTELFYTRNSFLKKYGVQGNRWGTADYLCTRDYDTVYIEQDVVVTCRGSVNINAYSLLKSPHPCLRPHKECTLCGNISLEAQNA